MQTILLVDDDDIFRGALEITLRSAGYSVVCAADGAMAVKWLQQNQATVVISDIRMPNLDGIELTKLIRSRSQTPIILMTGFSQIIETQEAFAIGANEFLAKPFKGKEMVQAVERCLKGSKGHFDQDDDVYCRISLQDFLCGKAIDFGIYLKLSNKKHVKIAHKGEDISMERISQFRNKGINYLYMKTEDFRKYLGINLPYKNFPKNEEYYHKKMELLRIAGDVLLAKVFREGLDHQSFDDSVVFVENALNILAEDANVIDLLNTLNNHADYLFAHSLGVSLYGVMITNALKWKIPTHKFKVAVAGLFHEIGCKDIPLHLLERHRLKWDNTEVRLYESHPEKGVAILKDLPFVSSDILQIVHQHHEDCQGQGFPSKLKKHAIHPMAKIIAVTDEFCYRVIKFPARPLMNPVDAIKDMMNHSSKNYDNESILALGGLFGYRPFDTKLKKAVT